jgi:hypothetical protein
VHVVDPDGAEDVIGLYGSWESAKPLMKQLQFLVEASEDVIEGRPAWPSIVVFPTF